MIWASGTIPVIWEITICLSWGSLLKLDEYKTKCKCSVNGLSSSSFPSVAYWPFTQCQENTKQQLMKYVNQKIIKEKGSQEQTCFKAGIWTQRN
jgi:hypothetical protein